MDGQVKKPEVLNDRGHQTVLTNKDVLKKPDFTKVSGASQERQDFLDKNKMNG